MEECIADLKRIARTLGAPVVSVNDYFGRWRSDLQAQVEHCLRLEKLGRTIIEILASDPNDYFVFKPKHSGFFSSDLDLLMPHLGVETVVLAGVAANICVLFAANDAYMCDLQVIVPADWVASNMKEETDYALQQMKQVLKADIRCLGELDLAASMQK